MFCPSAPPLSLSDFEAASSKAGKVENEVKRLHNLIVDINSHKLKAQQDKLDKVNKGLDDCSSTITKAQVAIKTAGRWGTDPQCVHRISDPLGPRNIQETSYLPGLVVAFLEIINQTSNQWNL